ncbi:pyridoxamine 5'-phosphate oxidase family protein [Brevibacterium aurantiacum]|uniref:General stress protein 26 n=1 Tax=Brevibacterium aurantiacum TaxID=273384 RepID=A0A2H1J3N0_BREAU|nr:pyridoxamine 5'-phosphate oxidase family protein [Brevibacterium aurantiacum]SMX81822.1 General stress protein 26 [Brevibacterium aurantiacum]
MSNRDTSNESTGEKKARDAAAKLDEATEPLGGTSEVDSQTQVGYTEENVEDRAQDTAADIGVTLHRNPDGSHTAVDESAVQAAENDTDASPAATGNATHQAGGADTGSLEQNDVVKILRDSGYVMLTTALDDGKLLAHPMVPQEVTDDADVWFFLGMQGDQAKALLQNPEVNITVAEAGNWLSVSGRVEFIDDQDKMDELWNDETAAWFEGGRHDPDLGLIKVTGESAQHWGLKGGKVAGLAQIVKAKITGQRTGGGSSTTEL